MFQLTQLYHACKTETMLFLAGGIFLLILPLSGLLIIFYQLLNSWRKLFLLLRGTIAQAQIKNKQSTNITINGKTIWRSDLSFQDAEMRERICTFRTQKSDLANEPIAVLFKKSNPEICYALPDLPGAPQLIGGNELKFSAAFHKGLLIVPSLITLNVLMAYVALV